MIARRRVLLLALAGATGRALGASAASAPRKAARAALPAANFLVEWRVQPAAAAPAAGGFTIGTRDAATGSSGFGAGTRIVGTARAAAPQGVRVANGKEATLQFDTVRHRTVYDIAWSARSEAESASGTAQAQAQGAAGHEVALHRIDGLRVTPHWTHGDTLALDLELTQVAPAADAEAHATRTIDFRSTVQLSFDEWQGVARVGDGGDELQVRVSWR